jgi:flavin-dependent dehydrogenase
VSKAWDVIVVGGGPGGALAAKKCAESGLETLLLEKKRMPRDKCCSGMVMAEWGQAIVRDEFGEYPEHVQRESVTLLGYALHSPGAPIETLDVTTPTTWRRTLDTWMCDAAAEAGAELWDSARVVGIAEDDASCVVQLDKDGLRRDLRSRFVIGADGGNSAVRRALFPAFQPVQLFGYREVYEITLELPERRFNMFAGLGPGRMFFTHEKGDCTLIEGVALGETPRAMAARARQFLIDNHGLDPDLEPAWRDGCAQPAMYSELSSGSFRPACGNVLLVGDAAGLNVPVTGEGLATALRSGRDAAHAVVEARERGQMAAGIFLEAIDEILGRFHEVASFGRRVIEVAEEGDPRARARATLTAWDRALKLF